jgi:magnesium transporter
MESLTRDKLNLDIVDLGKVKWINIERPGEAEIEYLAHNFSFHPLDLDDCLSRVQLPKIDEYEKYMFIVLHFPLFSKTERLTLPSQVSIFISHDYLVTLHQGSLKPVVKLFLNLKLHPEDREEYQGSPGHLLYRIVDRLVDYCFPILGKIGENTDQVEENIFSADTRKMVEEISVLRRDIISYRRIVWPLRSVIASLEEKTRRFTTEDLTAYWGDVVDHIDKISYTLNGYKEMIEGLNDTVNSLYSHRISDVMKVLTVMATIMLPLSVITGMYGMNIDLPGQSSPQAFATILGIMLAVAGGMLFFFRRHHWI